MNTITGQLAAVQQLLERVDRHSRTEAQIGSLILAVEKLAEIVGTQAQRIDDLAHVQNERATD